MIGRTVCLVRSFDRAPDLLAGGCGFVLHQLHLLLLEVSSGTVPYLEAIHVHVGLSPGTAVHKKPL